MTVHHEIGELDRQGVMLRPTRREARALVRTIDRLGVDWRPDGSVRVFSKGQVGSVALSPDTVITVTTKVPVANVLGLVSLAYRTVPIAGPVGYALLDANPSAFDWLAFLFVAEVEALLSQGRRCDYVLAEDELPYIRGRLRFGRSAVAARPGLVPCEFTDLVADVVENRILRATLELLMTQRLLPSLQRRVEQLAPALAGVTLVRPTARLLASCRYTRLNQHYRPALELGGLLIRQAGVELTPGDTAAPAYFFPMERVFQEAVTTFLGRRLPGVHRQLSRSHSPTTGDPPRPLRFVADIVVGDPPRLVIDTKYASAEALNQYGGRSFRNDHVYQAAFYALSLGCPALLVYPRADRDVDTTFRVAGVTTTILTIDLANPDLAALDCLVQRVGSLMDVSKVTESQR
jgi:5-methylcytosine-specific restriction enzyme subunit McrC